MSAGNNSRVESEENIETIDIGSFENELGDADFDIAKERFMLARDILLFLFCLVIFIIIIRIFPDNLEKQEIKELFNTIFQSIVPIASLIIGYYFGSKGSKE